ncbi:hypothetical protein VP01_4305g1, partial [Puccinia sorghi]
MTHISNFISQSNTRIENTVKSAVKQLKAQVLESKSDFLKQAKEEILRLGSQNKWDKLDQKLGKVTQDTSINVANLHNLSKKMESIKYVPTPNQGEIETLQEQVTSSIFDKNAFDKDVAELKKQLKVLKDDLRAMVLEESRASQ